MSRRRVRVVVGGCLAIVVACAAVVVVAMTGKSTKAGRPALTAGSAGTPAAALCGFPNPDRITAVPGGAPSISPKAVVSHLKDDNGRFRGLQQAGNRLAVLQDSGNSPTITTYSLSGHQLSRITVKIPHQPGQAPVQADSFVLGPDGSVYLVRDTTLVRYGPNGRKRWSSDLSALQPQSVTTIFPWHNAFGGFAIGVGLGRGGVAVVDDSGTVQQKVLPIKGDIFNPLPNGDLATTAHTSDGIYLYIYDGRGHQLAHFGSRHLADTTSPTGAPYAFNDPWGVSTLPGGDLLVADSGAGIVELSPSGMWRGIAPDGSLDPDLSFGLLNRTRLLRAGDRFYFAAASAGNADQANVVSLSVRDMQSWLALPVKLNAAQQSWESVLGVGAGLVSSAPDNYFGPGRTPQVSASFDPWWSAQAGKYRLRYTVLFPPRPNGTQPSETRTADLPAHGGTISLKLPPAQPGAYQVSAALVQRSTGAAVSGTCLNYSVGAAGDRLDLTALSTGADWGGPAPLRGVQLAAQLGLNSYRYAMDFSQVVPDPKATPSAAGLRWNSLPGADSGDPFAQIAAAASLAASKGVDFTVQVSQSDDNAKTAVQQGTWGGWVRQIVQAFRVHAPAVREWAPWNEPNNSGIDGKTYAQKVLHPFSEAVHAVDSAALVVGGNSLGVDPEWWSQLAAAGGCADLNIVAIHPYTGYNRSWEEDGLVGDIGKLKKVLAGCGAGRKPIWDTESAWWSDGPANFWQQGDDVARTAMWMRLEGITGWTYFISEGGYGDTGNSYSLIQLDDYVKSGALAFMTVDKLLADRPTPRLVDTGIPSSYAMDFAPSGGQDSRILAAWTDEFPVTARLTSTVDRPVTVTAYDVSGGTRTLHLPAGGSVPVQLSGSPVFYRSAAGAPLRLSPVESYGADVLIGAQASASSTAKGFSARSVLRDNAHNPNPWRSGPKGPKGGPDLHPTVTVTMKKAVTIDRVLVASPSINCCTGGLRNYTVSVRTPAGHWQVVSRAHDQFFQRTALFHFPEVSVTAVRVSIPTTKEKGVTVMDVNYSGAEGGLFPAWTKLQPSSDQIAAISAIAAYAPAS